MKEVISLSLIKFVVIAPSPQTAGVNKIVFYWVVISLWGCFFGSHLFLLVWKLSRLPCTCQLAHARPISTLVPVVAAYPSRGHVTWTMTVETALMNQTLVVSFRPYICMLYDHVFKDMFNDLFVLSLHPAYPTCFPLTQFTCANGRCININWRCDNGEYNPRSFKNVIGAVKP